MFSVKYLSNNKQVTVTQPQQFQQLVKMCLT